MNKIVYIIIVIALSLIMNGCAQKNPRILRNKTSGLTMAYSLNKKSEASIMAANYCKSKKMYSVTLVSEIKNNDILIGDWSCNYMNQRKKTYKKIVKTIQFIDQTYIKKVSLNQMINSAINNIINSTEDKMPESAVLDIKKQYELGADTRMQALLKLTTSIEIVEKNTNYTLNEIVDIAINGITNCLDEYSSYKNQNDFNKIVKDTTPTKPIQSKIIDNKFLYVKIFNFENDTAKNLKNIINQEKNRTNGIILDLRDNPGGLFDQSIATADLFLNSGIIVSTKGRVKTVDKIYYAKKETTITDIPLVILVNNKTASGSEIVASSLQESKRAKIIGEKTMGRGLLQIIFPISNNKQEAILLTIAQLVTRDGKFISDAVSPDYKIQNYDSLIDNQLDTAIKLIQK